MVLISELIFEITGFDLGGELLWTQTTLDKLPSAGDSLNFADQVAINIDGKPLLLTSNDKFIYLSGSLYQMVANSDPAMHDSWTHREGFVVRIAPLSGDLLARHSTLSDVTSLSIADDGSIALTVLNGEGLFQEILLNPVTLVSE